MKADIVRKPHIQVFIIIILGLLVYSNTLFAPFTFDDAYYIVSNPAIKDFGYFREPSRVLELNNITVGHRAAFITRIGTHFTFALNYHLHRLDVTGYHLFNIAVHVINGLLVYGLMGLIFKTPFFARSKTDEGSDIPFTPDVFAFFAALLFVSHPIQTQAVTYISQRFASLATLFFLLSLVAYIKSRLSNNNQEKYILYGSSFLSAVLAMLMKEISFTLPVIITLAEFMFFRDKLRQRLVRLLPLALTMLIIPSRLLMAAGASFSIGNIDQSMKSLTTGTADAVTRWEYLFTQFRVIVTYLRLLFFPANQNIDYDYPIYGTFFTPQVMLSFAFLALLFFLAVFLYFQTQKSRSANRHALMLISFGLLWFFITLSVESSIVVLRNVIFEHRLYLPSVGFILCVLALVSIAANQMKKRTAVISFMALVIFVLAGTAYGRNAVWRNNIVLWEDVVSKSPQKARPHLNLGVAYDNHGRTEEAFREYTQALEIDPNYVQAHNKRGFIYMQQGQMDEAINEYLLSLEISPDNFDAHNNLGIAFAQSGSFGEALEQFQAARGIAPGNISVQKNIETVMRLMDQESAETNKRNESK